jgi:hypothetical protein
MVPRMKKSSLLSLVFVVLFLFSLVHLTGDSFLVTDLGQPLNEQHRVADGGGTYVGTGSPLTVTFSGTFVNSSSWSDTTTTLSSDFTSGTSFLVTNSSSVIWTAYILVSPPSEVESLSFSVSFPGTEWCPTSLTNPVGNSMAWPSQWWYDSDTVFVSTAAVITYGIWKLEFLGVNQLSDLVLGESSGPLSSTAIFDINDQMLFRSTSTWISGSTVEYVLTDPSGSTWYSATNTTSGVTSHLLQSFRYRKDITIDRSRHLGTSLTNFPVLIDIYDSDLHTKVQSDGDDIVFYAGGKIVPYEIELFDQNYSPTQAHLIAWVKVNLTGSVNTVITMYYGNSLIGSQQQPELVWTQNFAAVWHLKETATAGGTSTVHYDSTANNYDGQQNGNANAVGKISIGQRFDGSNDQIVISSSKGLNPSGDIEISAWFKLDTTFTSTTQYTQPIVVKYLDGNNNLNIALAGTDYTFLSSPGSLVFKIENGGAQKYKYTTPRTWTAGVWYHVICFIDSDTPDNNKIFINGADSTYGSTGPLTSASVTFSTDWGVGGGYIDQGGQSTVWFDGVIDEVRISKTIRSAAWCAGSYSNQYNPSNFYAVGSEQQRVSPELSIKKIIDNTAISGVWKVSAFYNDSGSSVNYRVGMYERFFTIMRSSSIAVTAPSSAIGNGVVSLVVNDILYTEVSVTDSLTGGISGATVAMNWTGGPVYLNDMGGGVYGLAVNTSNLVTNMRWLINLVVTHPYHRSSSTYFYLDLYHETRLDYSDVTTTPVGFDSNATLTFYDDYNSDPISEATLRFANGDPVTILSQSNGVYGITVDTSSLAQGKYTYTINATKPGSFYVMATARITFTIRPHFTALSVSGNIETPFGDDTTLTVQLIDLDTNTPVNIAYVTSLSFTSSYGTQVRFAYNVVLSTDTWTVALADVTLSAVMASANYYTPDPYDFQINIRKHYTTISVTGGLVNPYGNATPLTITITDLDTGTLLLSTSSIQSFTFTSSYAPYTENDPIADFYVELPTGTWVVGSHAVTLQLTMKASSDYFSPSDYAFTLTIRSMTTVLYNAPNDLIFPNGDDLVIILQFNVSEHGSYYGEPIDGVLASAFYVTSPSSFVYPKSVVGLGDGRYQLTISSTYFAAGPYTIFITVSPASSLYARTDMVLNFEYRAARSDLTANLYTVSTPYRFNVTVTLSYWDLDRASGITTGEIYSPDTWVSYTHTGGGSYSVVIGVYSLSLGTHPINLTAQASGYDTRSVIISVTITKIHTDADATVVSLDVPVGNTKVFYIDLVDLDNGGPIPSVIPIDDWAGSVPISVVWTGTRYEVTFTTTGSDTLGLYVITFTFSPGTNYFDASCEVEVDLRTHITIFNLVSAVEPTPFNGIVNISLRYYDFDNKVGITDDSNIQVLVWNQTDWIATNLVNEGSGYYTLQIAASLFGQGLQYFDIYFNWEGPVQQYEDKSTTASVNIIGIDSQIALLSASEPTAYLGVMTYVFLYSELSGLGITNSSYGGGNVHISVSFQGVSVDLSEVTIAELDPVLQPGKYSISFNTTIFSKTGLIYMNVYINWSAGVAPYYTNRADVISVRVLPRDTLLAVIPPSPTAYGENATLTFTFDDVTGGSNVPIANNPVLSVILSLGDYSLTYNPVTYIFTVSFDTSQFGAPLGQKSFTLGVTWAGAPFYANRTGRVIYVTVTARQTTLDFQAPAPTSYLNNVTLTLEWNDVTSVPTTGISTATIQLYDVTGASYIPSTYYTVYWISGGQYEIAFNTSYYSTPSTYSLRVYLSTPEFYILDVSSTRPFNVLYRLTLLSAEPIGLVPYNSSLVYTLDFQDLETLETIPYDGGKVTIVVLDVGWTYVVVWNPSYQTYTLTIETYNHPELVVGTQYSLHIQASYASQSPFYGSDDTYITFKLRTRQSDLIIDDPPDPTAYLEYAQFRVYYFDVDSSSGITATSIVVRKGIFTLIQGTDYTLVYQGSGYYLLSVDSTKLDGLGITTLNIEAQWTSGAPYHDSADVDVNIYVTKREANVEITVPPTQTRFLDNVVFSFVYRDLRSGLAIETITSANVAIWAGGGLLTPVVQYTISQVGSTFTVYVNSTSLSSSLVTNYNVTVRVDWNDVTAPYYIDDSTLVRVTTTNRRMSYAVLPAEEAAYGELLNLSFRISDADSGRAVVLASGNILFDGKTVALTEGVDFSIDFSQSSLGIYTIRISTVAVGLPNTYLFNLYVNWNPASQPYYLSLTPVNPIEMSGVISKIDTILYHVGPEPETAVWGDAPIGITVNYTNLVFGNLTTGATVTWTWNEAGVEFGPTGEPLGDGVYVANINQSLANAGTYIISFRATGLAAYKDAYVYVTFVVTAAGSDMIPIDPADPVVNVDRGAELSITILLQDGTSNPIADNYVNEVRATFDSVTYFDLSYTGTPGMYFVTLPANDESATKRAPGSYTIIITASMDNYEPAAYSFKIYILQTRTAVTLTGGTPVDLSRTYTENVTVYVQLILPDLGNIPFENATVQWIVADTAISGNFTHIGNGNFTAIISTTIVGFGIWNVIFKATPWENASLYASSQIIISFSVKRIQTSSIPPPTRDFYWGWTGYLEFIYWDETFDVGIEGADVSIELPGLESVVLDNGNGSYLVFFNTTLLRAGTSYIPLPVIFNKLNYVPSSSTINIRVLEVPTDIYVYEIVYTPTYMGVLESFGNNDTVNLQIPFGDSMVIDFFYNDTDSSEGYLGGLTGATATPNSALRGPSLDTPLNVTLISLGHGLYRVIFDTTDPLLTAIISAEAYRLYIEMSLDNRTTTDINFRIEVINTPTELRIIGVNGGSSPPIEWVLTNGDPYEIEFYYFDTWHGTGITGAMMSANASAGAPFSATIYEGSEDGQYFVSISSRGVMFNPSSGTLTIRVGQEFYDFGTELVVLNVAQNSIDQMTTTGVTYGLPISLVVILLLGAYVKVWSIPKRIRQINGLLKSIRRGRVPKPIGNVKSRRKLVADLFNDTFEGTGITRGPDQLPEESIPVEVPELGELLIQLSILTNLNQQELDDFKADIAKMKMSEQAAFVKEVIMQEAIRAARREGKSIDDIMSELRAESSKRLAGEEERKTPRDEGIDELEEPEEEPVLLPQEEEGPEPERVRRPEVPSEPTEDISFASDYMSPFEIEELRKSLLAKGVQPSEIDVILKQARELPRELVEELIRSLDAERLRRG